MLLYVWARQRALSPDPYVAVQQYRPGHIIDALPDTHTPSPEERAHPNWIILKVPLTRAVASDYLYPEGGDRRVDRMLRRRLVALDLTKLPARVKLKITLGRTADEPYVITRAELDAARVLVAKDPDPAILGGDGGVIG